MAKSELQQLPVAELRSSLRSWYQQSGRDLPWRQTRDPYAIWVSEIMLQQTQVKTVIPYYHRWLAQFPSIASLAAAPQQKVLKVWQGLGYYARARNLHRAAQLVVTDWDGQFPQTFDQVVSLPGIGRTTAGGILSAAWNQPTPILDGNVKRILVRLMAIPLPPKQVMADLWETSAAILDPEYPREFNQAFMDLGATLCIPKQPLCDRCPWMPYCQAYRHQLQTTLPMTEPRAPLPHKQIGVAVIWNDQGQILIDKRPQKGLLGGLWEFPGGKVEPQESVPDCIQREIKEELGIDITVEDHLITVNHAYTHFKVTLTVHHCRHIQGEPQPLECDQIRWVTLDELDQYPFPKANQEIIAALRAEQKS